MFESYTVFHLSVCKYIDLNLPMAVKGIFLFVFLKLIAMEIITNTTGIIICLIVTELLNSNKIIGAMN